ncbi:hypothetical protein FQZ97_932290 [compost metagenome]
MVSSVTPAVLARPWHTMPSESPTRMHSTPAASATAAKVASYAVSMVIFSPRSRNSFRRGRLTGLRWGRGEAVGSVP